MLQPSGRWMQSEHKNMEHKVEFVDGGFSNRRFAHAKCLRFGGLDRCFGGGHSKAPTRIGNASACPRQRVRPQPLAFSVAFSKNRVPFQGFFGG